MPNPYQRLLALTYNGVSVGQNSTLGEPTTWGVTVTPENGIVKMRFVVASTNSNALANMAAIEAAFSVRRKHLTIVYNAATTINDFDPSLTTLTGYEAFPEIRHGDEIPGPHAIDCETYEITVKFRRPADNNGRRDERPGIDRTLAARQRVRFDGVWTAVAGSQGAREHFEDPSTGFEPHATTFLAGYDNVTTWTEAVHDVVVNDTDTEVSYHCEFWAHVHGQVNEERTVHQDLHGLRRILVSGTWIDPAGILSGSALAALAAFNDATNGFVAQINAWYIATYPGTAFAVYALDPRPNAINGTVDYTAELWEVEVNATVNTGRRFSQVSVDPLPSGRVQVSVDAVYMQTVVSGSTITAVTNYKDATNGMVALVAAVQIAVSTQQGGGLVWDGAIVTRYKYNEQLGIVETTWAFKEITGFNNIAGGTRDPDILEDQWDLVSSTEGPGDSPLSLGGQTTSSGGGVKRPIRLEASYRAWIKKGVDPITKWTSVVQSYVISTVNSKLKPATVPGAALRIVPEVDPRNNTLTAHVTLESFASTYLEFSVDETLSRDNGYIYSPKLDGQQDSYDFQQGPSMGTKVRTTRLLSTQTNAIYQFASGDSISGYRRLRYRVGQRAIVVGVAPLQTTLYAAEMEEEFLAVGAVSQGSAASGGSETQATRVPAAQGANGGGNLPGGSPQQNGGGAGNGAGSDGAGNMPGGVPQALQKLLNQGEIFSGVQNTSGSGTGAGLFSSGGTRDLSGGGFVGEL